MECRISRCVKDPEWSAGSIGVCRISGSAGLHDQYFVIKRESVESAGACMVRRSVLDQ